MPPTKPHNHVTRALLEAAAGAPSDLIPEVPEDLLLFLEKLYPPKCYTARGESLEQHLLYAGMVELVAYLRASYEEQVEAGMALDPEDLVGEDD